MRGDTYRLRKGKGAEAAAGHEQDGARYAIVVQSSRAHFSTWLICPTSTSCLASPLRPEVTLDGRKTRVMVDQLTAIDPERRIGEYVGILPLADMQEIDRVLRRLLDLP